MIRLTGRRAMLRAVTGRRGLLVALAAATGAIIVAAIGNRLHFYAPECSAWLGVI